MANGVTRREFLDGVACAVVAGSLPGSSSAQSTAYPPGRSGYGGSRPEDLAIAHGVRGGQRRRYELNGDGRFLVGYGGSESLERPKTRWTGVARACVASLGVNLDGFDTAFQLQLYPGVGLSSGLFFPRETFGIDR